MKLSSMKIKIQLQFGFAIIIIFVLTIGVVAWFQTGAIAEQTRILYNNPIQVWRAIGEIKADILSIHLGMKDLMLSHSETEIAETITKMDTLQANAMDQIEILYSRYLGPRSDVDQVKQEFIQWNAIRTETIRLLRAGQTREATARTQSGGPGGDQVEVLLNSLGQIDTFAKNKGDELFGNSQLLKNELNLQLVLFVGSALLMSLVIVLYLLRNIRQPLNELARSMQAFKTGDLSSRSPYALKNEFGALSDSYNQMAETIQQDTALKEKVSILASQMLGINDAVQFFQATLSTLAENSSSQMAAVYLLNNDQKSFEHFASIGLFEGARVSFAADNFEGEFGAALASKKIQHIANIPEDTRFTFYTVGGQFAPREIITIPILTDQQIIAIISLATLGSFSQQAIRFIDAIWVTLNARVTGILAFRQIQALAAHLEQQNLELEAQKNELNAQTAELNHQNTELEAQKKQLGEASRLKTSFISNMSHELRTPLNSVIALSGVLNRRLVNQIPEEEYSYLEVIERNGKQLLTLINDILDLSRIEAGHEEIEVSQFNINHIVTDVVTVLNPLAQHKGIQILSFLNPGLPPMISDATKCLHILQNLVNNAIKFTEAGQVEIGLQQKGDRVEIAVSDSGIGISKEHLPHIFDEFRQADSSTSRKYGGTGLGLAIVKKYAQLLDGSISVKSVLGEGSVFTLSLPLRLEHDSSDYETEVSSLNEPPRKAPRSETLPGQSQKTILVVEDSEPAIIQLKDILEEQAFSVLVARNGSEALEIIRYTQPDAMILDLMMPGVDGFEVLRNVRETEQTTHLPVLILTAKHITKDELKFLKRNNVYQLIQKGAINRNELLYAVTSMVRPETPKNEKPQPVPQSIEGKPVVLVVEDNPDNLLTVKALLDNDFLVIEAMDGRAGIEMAKEHLPHLILMDIALPVLDGIQAFNAIRSLIQLQNIPIIALTASAMTSDRETILAYGFDGYIPKPIDHLEFMHTIKQVLYGK